MNKNSTITRIALHLFSAVMLLTIFGSTASAQINVALTADTVMHGPCCGAAYPGTGTGDPTTAVYGFGPYHYNDNYLPPYGANGMYTPSTGPNWNFTYVMSGGWIKFVWTTAMQFNKIVLYKNDRPLNSFDLQVGGGATYTTVYSYNNQTNVVADSVFFDIPIVVPFGDTLRFNNVQTANGLNHPSSREIQIWNIPACTGTPTSTIITPTTTPCYGSTIYMSATSNNTSSNHGYQWEYSTPAAPTTWITIPGATGPGYAFHASTALNFRVGDTCKLNGLWSNSNTLSINPAPAPLYQPIGATGYYMGFDNAWSTLCAVAPFTLDVPGPGWTNDPPSGYGTWRRNDVTAATLASTGWNNINNSPTTPTWGGFFARSHTSGMIPLIPNNLDLYVNCSTPIGDKQLYFYYQNSINGLPSGDSLKVLMSLDEGLTWTLLGGFDTTTSAIWRKKSLPIQSNNAKTIIRFQTTKYLGANATDIGLDSVFVAPPCSGTLVGGNVTMPATTLTCAGATLTMSTIGTTMGGNIVYTWEYSINGGAAWNPVNGGIGSNTATFTTPPLYDTTMFRLKVTCGPTGTPAYSNAITVNIAKEPQYALIPYSNSFETWISRCNTSSPVGCTTCGLEVPSINWANWPVTGNNSWRRDADGAQASWASIGAAVAPLHLARTARFHSTQVTLGVTGSLDLLVNLSTFPGTKELRFSTNNTTGNDSLAVSYSTDAGLNFTPLTTVLANNAGWVNVTLPLPTSSPTTIIRFKGYGDFNTAGSDIYVDTVTVIPACTGSPNPGSIGNVVPCPGVNFTLNLQNSTFAGSLTYQWQDSIDGVSPNFTDIVGATTQAYTDNITTNKYYRVKVTCTNSGVTSITPVRYIQLASFYYCYCNSVATSATGADIGNVTVMRLPGGGIAMSNGTATPLNTNGTAIRTYTDFRGAPLPAPPPNGLTPIVMYHDSTYAFFVTQINNGTFAAASVSLWIDTNRNGTFEPAEQFIASKATSASSNPPQRVSDTVTLTIDTTFIGITGMRVIIESPVNPNMGPCGNYPSGETEDYLVDLRAGPCSGPVNPGIAEISDTASCVGYTITLVDTTHEDYRSDIAWIWQYSPDGFSWADIAGSQGRDTVVHIVQGQTYFRMQMLCLNTLDTTFSNTVRVSINASYACYCFSQADGGNKDSSDVSSFQLGTKVLSSNGVGPHVKNATAFRPRTDFTKDPVTEIWNDSMYQIKVYHILRSNTHADAKITLFMDLNNDLQYNVTPTYTELIYTGFTTPTTFVLVDSIYVPPFAIPGVKTGMRLILNNNTAPNVPSDSACGTYPSGETEDYVIMFKSVLSVPELDNISQVAVYPNPTAGRFSLTFVAKKPVEHATITVSNLTGQKLKTKELKKPGKEFTQELDLTSMPRGVYFVELLADNERVVRKVIVK